VTVRNAVYTRKKNNIEIIKPSEHGLGIVYVPDKRTRYTPVDCKDQKANFPRWIVQAWERLLFDHFRNVTDPENALISRPVPSTDQNESEGLAGLIYQFGWREQGAWLQARTIFKSADYGLGAP
jgi:hypothetical protein